MIAGNGTHIFNNNRGNNSSRFCTVRADGLRNTCTNIGWTLGAGIELAVSVNRTVKGDYFHAATNCRRGWRLTPAPASQLLFLSEIAIATMA
ncbi:MAG: hypothetical protein AB7F96_15695 [Beijerinckiaceae bacterium]